MPSVFIKTALLISSFAPITLVWSMVSFVENKYCLTLPTIIIFIVFLLFFLLPPYILSKCRKKIASDRITYNSVALLENGGEGFVGTYILPFLSLAVTDDWYLLMVGIMIILTLIMWINNSFCFNPALSFFRYRFYQVTNSKNVTFILLSKRKIIDPDTIKNVIDITDYLKLDRDGA